MRTVFAFLIMLFSHYSVANGTLGRALTDTEIQSLEQNLKKNPQNVRSRLFLANHYFKTQKWNSVITLLQPVNEKIDDETLIILGESYLKVGKNQEALSLADTLQNRSTVTEQQFSFIISVIDHNLSDPRSSISKSELQSRLFETLKTARSHFSTKHLFYDQWLSMLEKHIEHFSVEALRVVEDMKKNNLPLRPHHYSAICRYNYLAGYANEALQTCQQAITKDPQNPSNLIHLGKAEILSGDTASGKRKIASVGEKFSQSELALWEAGNTYFEDKNYGQALSFYQKATEQPERQARDYLGLAKAAFELRKYDIALKAFAQHCRLSNYLDQEFRRASGLLKDNPKWQERYRQKMMDCKPDVRNAD